MCAGLLGDGRWRPWPPHRLADVAAALFAFAQGRDLSGAIAALFAGEAINATENRAVLHMALRQPTRDFFAKGEAISDDVRKGLVAATQFANDVRAGVITAKDGRPFKAILHIGIGGSDLGPAFAVRALDQFVNHGSTAQPRRYRFVSNVDGHELNAVLRQCKPASTLFIIASKTFTTAETMLNATTARAWFAANGGTTDGSSSLDTSKHFCAVTTNVSAAKAFGISTTFGFWDWVGGRYSIWSAIGLSLAIAIGDVAFRAFLAGAHAMDEHFKTTPLAQNLPCA
jgi:glucose-6-phosphate isomerase